MSISSITVINMFISSSIRIIVIIVIEGGAFPWTRALAGAAAARGAAMGKKAKKSHDDGSLQVICVYMYICIYTYTYIYIYI